MACLQAPSQGMIDSEVSVIGENANAIIAAAVRVRSAALSRDRAAVETELAYLREVADASITLMETVGVPWSDKHMAPPSIEEMHSLGLLPQLIENAADNG